MGVCTIIRTHDKGNGQYSEGDDAAENPAAYHRALHSWEKYPAPGVFWLPSRAAACRLWSPWVTSVPVPVWVLILVIIHVAVWDRISVSWNIASII